MDILTEFAGLPVVEFPFDEETEEGAGWRQELRRIQESAEDPSVVPSVAWRLRSEGEVAKYFARFLAGVDTSQVRALTLGDAFDASEGVLGAAVDLLIEHADAFANLRAVFVGDVTYEESELSWISQSDLAPLLHAFPQLEELGVRGAENGMGGLLKLHVPSHGSLRTLTIESGGLPGSVTREVASSGLPALEHLELWLGVKEYGGTTSPQDLAPLLSGERFPRLRYLGVRNAEKLDEWIPVLAQAPVVKQLEVLDLSLGTLTDQGGQVLIDRSEAFFGLRKVDLHHHFLSPEMEERVRAAFTGAGVEVDLSERLEPEEDPGYEPRYYTAAAE